MGRDRLPVLDPLVVAYLDWCEKERTPVNTVRRRRTVLRSVGNPSTATREEIEEWWANRRHLAATSRACDLACLRSFYTWCQVWEHRADNPTVRLNPPRAGSGSPEPTTRREFDALLRYLDELTTAGSADAPRIRRAVLLAAWAGLRREEAAQLGWVHIDPETRRARVTGKGNKTRLVVFAEKLLDELGDDHGGNVVTGDRQGWAADTLGRKVNATMKAAGISGTMHKLRHRYGSVAYQRTKDPKALAEQMGHASVATTMSFYAAAADEAAAAIADAVVD